MQIPNVQCWRGGGRNGGGAFSWMFIVYDYPGHFQPDLNYAKIFCYVRPEKYFSKIIDVTLSWWKFDLGLW